MTKLRFLIIGATLSILSSCAQPQYIDLESSGINHSSPEVISLYDAENERIRREESSGGFLGWLIGGMVGSYPDNDYYDDNDHYHDRHRGRRNDSPKKKKQFISKNGETLRSKLAEKKR